MAHGHAGVILKPFTPLSLAPVLWLDAADTSTITSSSGAVSQWNDKSGNGYNVTQSTGAAQPGTGSVTQNGLNVLTFDGSQRLVASTASNWTFLHDGTKYFVSMAMQAGTTADPNALYGILSTTGASSSTRGATIGFEDRSGVSNNASRYDIFRGSLGTYVVGGYPADTQTANVFNILSHLMDPSNATKANRWSLRVNGSAASSPNTETGTVSASDPTYALSVGARGDNSFGLVGRIAEVIIVKGAAATDTNRQLIRDYLNAKWAVY